MHSKHKIDKFITDTKEDLAEIARQNKEAAKKEKEDKKAKKAKKDSKPRDETPPPSPGKRKKSIRKADKPSELKVKEKKSS